MVCGGGADAKKNVLESERMRSQTMRLNQPQVGTLLLKPPNNSNCNVQVLFVKRTLEMFAKWNMMNSPLLLHIFSNN